MINSSSDSLPVERVTSMSASGVDLVESWIFATSSRDFSIYSERLLLRMVQLAQAQLLGASFRDGTSVGQVEIGPLGEARLEVPIRSLLSPGSTNYSQAKAAIMELMRSPYFVERPKVRGGKPVVGPDGKPEYEFVGHQILNDCSVNVKPGAAVIEVNRETWLRILDFSKGFRKYSLETALKLKLTPSLRLFQLLSNQKEPITFTLEQLRTMWKMEERDPETGEYRVYPDTYNFIKRTIEPAKKELDEKAPWSFTYEKNYSASDPVNIGRKGKKAVTSITFFPVHRYTGEPQSSLVRMTSTALKELGKETYDLLVLKIGFTQKGLNNNVPLFHLANSLGMDLNGFVRLVTVGALRSENPPAYVIKAIKTHLQEVHGVVFGPDGKLVARED